MFLSLFLFALVVYVFGEIKPKRCYITRQETEALLKQIRDNQQREIEQQLSRLKIAEYHGQNVALLDSERDRLTEVSQSEIKRTKKSWLDMLSTLHDNGQLSDSEFDREVSKCLDS